MSKAVTKTTSVLKTKLHSKCINAKIGKSAADTAQGKARKSAIVIRPYNKAQRSRPPIIYYGIFLIFFNQKNKDAELLEQTGKRLNFKVLSFETTTHAEMKDIVVKYANDSETNYDFFACAILTDTEDHGVLYDGYDKTYKLHDFIAFTEDNCRKMNGKPKMYIVQAPPFQTCKSQLLDGPHTTIREPHNTIIIYSQSPEPSKNGKGTLFVETVCSQLIQGETKHRKIPQTFDRVAARMSKVVGLHKPFIENYLHQNTLRLCFNKTSRL